jgi:hypothetical protein
LRAGRIPAPFVRRHRPRGLHSLPKAYTVRFSGGTENRFEITLAVATLEFIRPPDIPKPAWTKLKHYRFSRP